MLVLGSGTGRRRRQLAHVAPTLLALCLGTVPGCQSVDDDFPLESASDDGTTDAGDDADGSSSTTGDPAQPCDPGRETCPAGLKCAAIVRGSPQASYECVADDSSLAPGEACTQDLAGGQDQCPTGHSCLSFDLEAPDGRCTQLCDSRTDCDGGECLFDPYSSASYCAIPCDPFAGECGGRLECHRLEDTFRCHPPELEQGTLPGSDCFGGGVAACDEGLICLPGALIPGCSSGACCARLCDLAQDDPCVSPASCTDLGASTSDASQSVGACFVPA